MEKKNRYYLYSHVEVTPGGTFTLVLDFKNNHAIKIPSSWMKFYDKPSHCFMLNQHHEMVSLIMDNNLGSTQFLGYKSVSKRFEFPFDFIDLIYDLDRIDDNIISQIHRFSDELIYNFHVRMFFSISMEELYEITSIIHRLGVECIEISISSLIDSDEKKLMEFLNEFPKVRWLTFYGSQQNEKYEINHQLIIFAEENLDVKHCGMVSPSYFRMNIPFYTLSRNHNNCLARKIAIDSKGNIKNCPSMNETYGNIRENSLREALEKHGFKKYWDINKDMIHVCKYCEFRYICSDCRAYVEDPEDLLSKPLKCGYNPYTGEWSEWSINPLKQKAIDFYGMREMVDMNDK